MCCLRLELGELSQQHDFGLHSKPFVVFMELLRKCIAAPAILNDGRMRNLNQKINFPYTP